MSSRYTFSSNFFQNVTGTEIILISRQNPQNESKVIQDGLSVNFKAISSAIAPIIRYLLQV